MRWLPLFLLAACGHEYGMHDRCTAGSGDYTVCPTEVDYHEAARRCGLLGQRLVVIENGPGAMAEQEVVELLAETALGPDASWWGGHAGTGYDCPAMQRCVSAPRPCDELRPYVCEL